MPSLPEPDDLLFRLSLIEGFSVRHLAHLSARERTPRPGIADEGLVPRGAEASLMRKGLDAVDSRESIRRASAVREACRRGGIRIVTIGSPGYPRLLGEVADAPLALYVRGGEAGAEESVAVVGSRCPTGPGKDFARSLACGLAGAGMTVVSGLARGIDTAAHEGALRGGGMTVAVLGCGVDVTYPPEASGLTARIASRGAVVSEYPPGTPPRPHRFPARNRIISGMARAVVVAEAGARSGALITARLALDQGREVMAVPGNPLFPHTGGSNGLLKDGAVPVTETEDVLRVLGREAKSPGAGKRDAREGTGGGLARDILGFLDTERRADEIALALGIPVAALMPELLDMELRKLLERTPGDYYKKSSR